MGPWALGQLVLILRNGSVSTSRCGGCTHTHTCADAEQPFEAVQLRDNRNLMKLPVSSTSQPTISLPDLQPKGALVNCQLATEVCKRRLRFRG